MDRSLGLITLSLDNQGRGTIGPRAITQKVNSENYANTSGKMMIHFFSLTLRSRARGFSSRHRAQRSRIM